MFVVFVLSSCKFQKCLVDKNNAVDHNCHSNYLFVGYYCIVADFD